MIDKTNKDAFDEAAKKKEEQDKKVKRNYSHKQLMSKLETYKSIAKTGEQQKFMNTQKEAYLKKNNKKVHDRMERNYNATMGIQVGIHDRNIVPQLMSNDKKIDQDDRNKVAKNAKSYYHRNYSVSKDFAKKASADKTKGKEKDIEKE